MIDFFKGLNHHTVHVGRGKERMRLRGERLMESVQLLSLIIKKMDYTGDGARIIWEERG